MTRAASPAPTRPDTPLAAPSDAPDTGPMTAEGGAMTDSGAIVFVVDRA